MNRPGPARCLLALDPGGSKCQALLIAPDGTVLSTGRAECPGLSGRSRELVQAAARQALGNHQPRSCHVATVSGLLAAEDYGFPPDVRVTVHRLSELDGPLALIDAAAGLVVVAGTGARISARQVDGRCLTIDGLGPLLGDHGSGYAIGRTALRAVAMTVAARGTRPATRLCDPLINACATALQSIGDDPNHCQLAGVALASYPPSVAEKLAPLLRLSLIPHDRSVIAGLARLVDDQARAGDEVACRILHTAADDLAESLRLMVAQLGVADRNLPLVALGSVIMRSDLYWDRFCERLTSIAPASQAQRIPHLPVVGTALAALPLVPEIDQVAARHRLLTTATSRLAGD